MNPTSSANDAVLSSWAPENGVAGCSGRFPQPDDHRLRRPHTLASFFPGGGLIAPAVENSGDQDFHVVSVVDHVILDGE